MLKNWNRFTEKKEGTHEPHHDTENVETGGNIDTTSARWQRGLCLANSDQPLRIQLGADNPGIMVGCNQSDSSGKQKYSSYYPISAFIYSLIKFSSVNSAKLAKNDTRRKSAWKTTYYRETNGEKLKENEDMCLLTEVRDNYWAYHGFNLIAGCDNAARWWAKLDNRNKKDYGGLQVSFKKFILKISFSVKWRGTDEAHKDKKGEDPYSTNYRAIKGLCHKSNKPLSFKQGDKDVTIMVACDGAGSNYEGYYPIPAINL